MDYCLTVRGTIGFEAASHGIRVLTAGTGRYDHRGFTTDSATRDEYLRRLSCIQTIPRLSAAERELAERFAYGLLVLRPLWLTTFTIEHDRDVEATTRIWFNARSREEMRNAADSRALAAWAGDRSAEDFIWPQARAALDVGAEAAAPADA